MAMEPFQGRLLVGVGRLLRIYDIGKKKLLRKCENKVSKWRGGLLYVLVCELAHSFLQHLPTLVVDIKTVGSRIFVSDVQEAVHFVRYKPVENQLVIFADETYQRWAHQLTYVYSALPVGCIPS